MSIKWPNGKQHKAFRKKVAQEAGKVMTGRLLAVDPASGKTSMPGYAVYDKGILVESGIIDVPSGNTAARLADLYGCFREDFKDVDVLAIEMLRGSMVNPVLHWAVGATLAAVNVSSVIEVPIATWKALAKHDPEYAKADDADAEAIGAVVVRFAGEKFKI